MKALMVLMVIAGVAALLVLQEADRRGQGMPAVQVATNFVAFRHAALQYAYAHRPEGDMPATDLDLPTGWRPLRNWRARIQDGHIYIWGEASSEEIEAARQLLWGSFAVGRADKGKLVPGHGGDVPVPGFVPDASLVSVVRADFPKE